MGEIMNSPKGVKSDVPERVSISCHTCGTRHDLPQITGSQSYVTVSEHSTYVTQQYPRAGTVIASDQAHVSNTNPLYINV